MVVERSAVAEFTERLLARVQRLRLGDGLDPATDVGPIINQRQLHRIHGYTEAGQQEAARLLDRAGRSPPDGARGGRTLLPSHALHR
ncbi:Aldehyde dehydrogenase domain protein, partial [mine drainage metagenome]